jgi:hypothetical protein
MIAAGSSGNHFEITSEIPTRQSRNKGSKRFFHHRGTEFAEFGAFLDQEPVTRRPPRLRGEFSSGSILSE